MQSSSLTLLDIFEEEMAMSDRVHLYHPNKEGYFYVFEKKSHRVLWHGVYVFYITPHAEYAVRRKLGSIASIHTYLKLLHKQGWRYNEHEDVELDIPKLTLVSWYECNRIRECSPMMNKNNHNNKSWWWNPHFFWKI